MARRSRAVSSCTGRSRRRRPWRSAPRSTSCNASSRNDRRSSTRSTSETLAARGSRVPGGRSRPRRALRPKRSARSRHTPSHSGQLASLRSSRTSSSLASASTSLTLSDAAEFPESLGQARPPDQARLKAADAAQKERIGVNGKRLYDARLEGDLVTVEQLVGLVVARINQACSASRRATRPQSRRCSRRTSDKRDTPGSRRSRAPTSRIARYAVFSAPTETL